MWLADNNESDDCLNPLALNGSEDSDHWKWGDLNIDQWISKGCCEGPH